MELLQTILALLLTLGILVTVHEAGHFFLARYFGVRVLRFSLGMGPVLWRRQGAGGTEFALSLLPLGGYVKMLEGEADGIASAPRQRAFSETHPAARIAIALGGPVANLLLAVLVYWVLFVSGVTGLVPYVKAVEGAEARGRGPSAGRRRPGNPKLERRQRGLGPAPRGIGADHLYAGRGAGPLDPRASHRALARRCGGSSVSFGA